MPLTAGFTHQPWPRAWQEVLRRWLLAGRWVGLLAAGLGAAAQASVLPYSVVDDGGHSTRFTAVPQRVVSLLPSLTESVCALGACARLVGTDRYSNWPAQVQGLPKLGGGLDPNMEAVLALKPDVVLMAQSSPGVQRLRALGLKVLALEPRDRQGLEQVMQKIAHTLHMAPTQVGAVLQGMEGEVQAVVQQVPAHLRLRKVYFEVSAAPYAAGEASFMGELLTRLGLSNIVPASMGPFPKLNPEWVLRHPPDIIMLTDSSLAHLRKRPGWSSAPPLKAALKNACTFTPQEADVLVRPGPRLGEAAALILRCLKAQDHLRP